MMRNRLVAPLLPLMGASLLCSDALGLDLELVAGGSSGYNSNVFGSTQDEKGDFELRFQPSAELQDRAGRLRWAFQYQPSYRYYLDAGEAAGWDHDVTGRVSWRIAPSLELQAEDRFVRTTSLSLLEQELLAEGDTVVPDSDFRTGRSKLNRAKGTLTWRAAAGKSVTFDLSHQWNSFGGARGDTTLLRSSLRYLQYVGQDAQLGGGFAVSLQTLEGTGQAADRSNVFYNAFLSWIQNLSPTLSVSLSAGPTWVAGEDVEDPPDLLEDVPVYPLEPRTDRFLRAASTCPVRDSVSVLSPDCELIPQPLYPGEVAFLQAQTTTLRREGRTPSSTSSSLTYFADLSVTKVWEHWLATFAYSRQAAQSTTGFGTGSVADTLSARLQWTPESRWTVSLLGSVVRREQTSKSITSAIAVVPDTLELPCDSATLLGRPNLPSGSFGGICRVFDDVSFVLRRFDNRPLTLADVARTSALRSIEVEQDLQEIQYFVALRVSYRLRKNVTVRAVANYRLVTYRDSVFERPDTDRYSISLALTYRFDPIYF